MSNSSNQRYSNPDLKNFISFDGNKDKSVTKSKKDENMFTFIDNQINSNKEDSIGRKIPNKFSFGSFQIKEGLREMDLKNNFNKQILFQSSEFPNDTHHTNINSNKNIKDSSNIFFTEFSTYSKSGSNLNQVSCNSKHLLSNQFDKESTFEEFSKSGNDFFDTDNILIHDMEKDQQNFSSQRKINQKTNHKRRNSYFYEQSKKNRTSIQQEYLPENGLKQIIANNNQDVNMIEKFNNQKIFTFNSITKENKNSSQEK